MRIPARARARARAQRSGARIAGVANHIHPWIKKTGWKRNPRGIVDRGFAAVFEHEQEQDSRLRLSELDRGAIHDFASKVFTLTPIGISIQKI